MALDSVETLQRLIRIPSVNPMGRPLTEPTQGEGRVTDFLQSICDQHRWPWLRQAVHPGRENILAVVAGNPAVDAGGELLLWDVHQDTVAVHGMTVAPFGGEVRDGRVYGRGACDVKGAMTAMVAALSRVSEPSPNPSLQGRGSAKRPTIVIAFTANEECGFTGARALCELWDPERRDTVEITGGSATPEKLFPRAPDAAIVAEPTEFDVVVAHHGVVRWRCHTHGRAAHTSRPDQGINAIYAMAEVIRSIEGYHKWLQKTAPEHPLCGRPSACVSTIHGGVGVNTVPERATIEIDRRCSPNYLPADGYRQLVEHIAANADLGGCRIEHDRPFMDSNGLGDKNNRELAEGLAMLARGTGRDAKLVGVPYGTDAAAISAVGVPTVVFGPGAIAQAHTADEFIEIDQLERGAEVFYRIAMGELNR
jgi:acetylornithine deacetylase/succinyl-diaminopimelate desuccinylase-like protein